jgi:hypothetical protein
LKLPELNSCIFYRPPIKFLIYQIEKETHLHAQGYMELTVSMRMEAVKALFNPPFNRFVHLESARKPPEANIKYCSKPDTRYQSTVEPFKFGSSSGYGDGAVAEFGPAGKKKECKLSKVMDCIHEGKLIDEMILDIEHRELWAAILRNKNDLRGLEVTLWKRRPYENRPLCNEWIYGPPGSGKTSSIGRRWPQEVAAGVVYSKPPVDNGNSIWFEGIDTLVKILVWNEPSHDMSPEQLIQLMDYSNSLIIVPIKGGHCPLPRLQCVVFFANNHPLDQWHYRQCKRTGDPCKCTDAQMRAFISRITRTAQLLGNGEDRRREFVGEPIPPSNPAWNDELIPLDIHSELSKLQ